MHADVINERGTTIDRATGWGPIPLPKLPASATEAQKRVLQRWEAAAAKALEDRKAASKALNERMAERTAKASREALRSGAGGFSVPYDGGDKPLRDAHDLATSRYKASIEAYLGTYEAASKGTELRYNDAGQITEIRYPTGGSAEMTWEGPNIRSLTLVEGNGSRTRIYPTGHRAREWRLDVGKGDGDPLAFTGRVNVLPNGTIERVPWDTKSQKSRRGSSQGRDRGLGGVARSQPRGTDHRDAMVPGPTSRWRRGSSAPGGGDRRRRQEAAAALSNWNRCANGSEDRRHWPR